LAEPPSLVGTGGGHIGEKEPGAVAVEVAAWLDVSGISPGNSKGAWEVVPEPEPAVPPAPAAPVVALPDPLAVDDSDDVPACDVACDPADADDSDDVEDVGDGVEDVDIDPVVFSPLVV
jgi:hypothetical protein